ncbi:MAG: GDSL-type esterase/lipase family protein [Bacteroidota bacterium]|nr:GDSL-type esterase/lipase family protein [Bacteroidota bacterium]
MIMRKKNQVLFRLSIIMNVIVIIGILGFLYKNTHKKNEQAVSDRAYNVVMFGNSLTAGGNWNQELNRLNVKNSGFPGFTTSHFVWLLNDEVLKFKPKICFIEGGINDIGVGIPLKRTCENYEAIVETLMKNKIEPVLQSTLYVHRPDDSIMNSAADSLNYFLASLASRKNLLYLNLNQFLSENKRLKEEFTTDGTHLKESAYKIWIREIEKILKRKGI